MRNNKPKIINLVLQAGGSHGAFTWEVPDRLLQDEHLRYEAISDASSGAITTALIEYGFAKTGMLAREMRAIAFCKNMRWLADIGKAA